MEKFLYLGLMLFTISGPLAFSFESRLHFVSQWKYLFPALGFMIAFFIPWDVVFTHSGVWGFNDRYILGIFIFGLPVEEWMFFVFAPFSCVFIYEVLNYYQRGLKHPNRGWRIARVVSIALVVLALFNTHRAYTFVTFVSCAAFLAYAGWVAKPHWLGRFFIAYLIVKLPFFLVNGVLTGMATPEPVVWYNNVENLAFRLITVPVEDTVYNLLMLLSVVWAMEHLRKNSNEITWKRTDAIQPLLKR